MKPDDGSPAFVCAREVFAGIDWSRTSLGPVERWPQRLQTAVEIVFANRFPMVVLWGPDIVQAAYNDAYAELIGARHPRAMGATNKAIWPEVWHINGPIYADVLHSGREFYFEDALYPLERNAWREEVYLTISYAPLRDDDGRIGGILATMVETSRNVLAERRLRSLREFASRTARMRSVRDIGWIAVKALAENTGDIVFVVIFSDAADDAQHAGEPGLSPPALLGYAGLDETDARDLAVIAQAVCAEGGSGLIELGLRGNGQPYAGGAFGQPVRDAHVAALPQASGSGPRSWIVVGLSPALPRDVRYREYLELIGAQLAAAFENAYAFSREHRIADTLQHAALPGTLPVFPGLSIDAVYEAGSDEAQIGGDWYDAFALGDGRVVISIGDVAGTGVVAAAAMGGARQMIRGLAQTLDDPVAVLDAVDRALRFESESLIVTAFLGFLSADHRLLSYASAGHPAPLVRHADGRIETLWAPDLPIGLREPATAGPAKIQLDEGSVVVLYTDGLTEATRDPLEGEARLRAAVEDEAFADHSRKASFLYECVLANRAKDDVALLVIELRRMFPFQPRRTAFAARSDPRATDVCGRTIVEESDEVRLMAKGQEAKKEKKKPKKDAKPKAK
ncbi:MAG: SpoIIE family protein phosphatase [Candidatus Velthaea sp.]